MRWMELIIRFAGICAVLLIFGHVYAYMIVRKPFPPHRTWLSVAIGDFVNDFGTGAQILLFTGNPYLALLPLINHIFFTGGPMILGQLTKHRVQDGGEILPELSDGDEIFPGLSEDLKNNGD